MSLLSLIRSCPRHTVAQLLAHNIPRRYVVTTCNSKPPPSKNDSDKQSDGDSGSRKSSDGPNHNSAYYWLLGGAIVSACSAGFIWYKNTCSIPADNQPDQCLSGVTTTHHHQPIDISERLHNASVERTDNDDSDQRYEVQSGLHSGEGDTDTKCACTNVTSTCGSTATSADPIHVPYVLIGAGTASFSAFRAIKTADPLARVVMISDEQHLPYMRAPLSKDLWHTDCLQTASRKLEFPTHGSSTRSIFIESSEQFFCKDVHELNTRAHGGLAIIRGSRVTSLDTDNRRVCVQDGRCISYDQCLVATGSRVSCHQPLDDCSDTSSAACYDIPPALLPVRQFVSGFRTIDDFRCLVDRLCSSKPAAAEATDTKPSDGALRKGEEEAAGDPTERPSRILVLGGSAVACELASSLSRRHHSDVTLAFSASTCMSEQLPTHLGESVNALMCQLGVCVRPGVHVRSASTTRGQHSAVAPGDTSDTAGGGVRVLLSDGSVHQYDHIVVVDAPQSSATCGQQEPDSSSSCEDTHSSFLHDSGLELDASGTGVLVNGELQARSGLWAAGEAACFYDTRGRQRRRLVGHDHAVSSGRLAGRNMVRSRCVSPDGASSVTGSRAELYTHQPMWWTDVAPSLSIESVGTIDPCLRTVSVFARPPCESQCEGVPVHCDTPGAAADTIDPRTMERGVVFYVRRDVIVGVLTWNLFGKMGVARRVLSERHSGEQAQELAKHFDLYEMERLLGQSSEPQQVEEQPVD